MSRRRVELTVDRRTDRLLVRWSAGPATGEATFDHVPGTAPAWVGAAEDLLGVADRRTADAVLDALADWARAHHLDLGVYHPDGDVERLLG